MSVLAASSLTEALSSIAASFEAAHPEVQVDMTFDGSARLATAIVGGAPADLFISADEATLTRVAKAGATTGPVEIIATNELQIVVPAGNPRGISGLADLAAGPVVAVCRVEVPCGAYAAKAFEAAGLLVPPAGREDSVKAVIAKVQLGEADAGLVYRTDVLAATGVTGVDLPADQRVRAAYPASVLTHARNARAAAAFLRFLRGAVARRALVAAGFGTP